jgi:hypothetical protein
MHANEMSYKCQLYPTTQLPHNFRYIVAIFIHNHFEFFESLNSTANFLHFG